MGRNRTTILVAALTLTAALALGAPPTASAASAEPDCYQIYLGEYDLGPVEIEASDSCIEVRVDTATPTSVKPDCYQIYLGEYDLGPAHVDASDSCIEVSIDEPALHSGTNCLHIYVEERVGPVTYTYTCSQGGELTVDENWIPGPSTTDDHTQPEDDPHAMAKCALTADGGTERFTCVFGPPGP